MQIIVRRAALDERMTTLDGVERTLNPSISGHCGCGARRGARRNHGRSGNGNLRENHECVSGKRLVHPQSIRKTARSLGMNTEASYRFERGADIEMARMACDRAAAMIQELAGGEIHQGMHRCLSRQGRNRSTATLRRTRIARFLGAAVEDSIVDDIFSRLEFKADENAEGWTVEVPSFRVDVSTEQDLLEEIARHHGYDKFPGTLPAGAGTASYLPHEAEERQLRDLLSNSGYSEITTYSFSDEETERRFRPEYRSRQIPEPDDGGRNNSAHLAGSGNAQIASLESESRHS